MRRNCFAQPSQVLFLVLFCGLAVLRFASVEAGYIGIYGGGPLYKCNATQNIDEIKVSGFTELIVWSMEVKSTGDLNFNNEFLLASNGTYVGNLTHPNFGSDLASVKNGSVERITFSIGSSGFGDWEDIMNLVNSNGTGKDSILYKNFHALKEALPSLDALDFDDENGYDNSSTVEFAVMLGRLGFKVMMCPFGYNDYLTKVVAEINRRRPGTVDGVHLQCYAGGAGNSPCTGWDFGPSVPVYPGLWDDYTTPDSVKSTIGEWHSQCNITGGFLWLEDDIAGRDKATQYATAFKAGLNMTD